jgi:predicted permease
LSLVTHTFSVGALSFIFSGAEYTYQKWADKRNDVDEPFVPDQDLTLSRKDWIGRGLQHWIAETYVNTLIFGIPMLSAIYGAKSVIYNVYASLSSLFFQLPILLIMFEYRRVFQIPKQQLRAQAISSMELGNVVPEAASNQEDGQENAANDSQQQSEPVDEASEILVEHKAEDQAVQNSEDASFAKQMLSFVKFALLAVVTNPPFIGILLGIFYSLVFTSNTSARYTNATGVHIKPAFLDNLSQWLTDTVTPLASFSIGLFAAKHFKGFARHWFRDLIYLVLKFLFVPVLAIAIMFMFGIDHSQARIGTLIAALPVALAAFTITENYACGNQAMAAQVVWGTILMLPVLIAWDQFMEAVDLFGSDPWRV